MSTSIYSFLYIKYYNQLDSRTDLSPIPVRSAVKSYKTSWCIQNLSKCALNRQTVSTSTTVLDTNRWQKELSPEFGEQEVQLLCSKFGFGFSDVKNEFRDFKDNWGNLLASMNALKYVINCIVTIPVSTAPSPQGSHSPYILGDN